MSHPVNATVVDRVEEGLSGERYVNDPVAFGREILDFEPWSKQIEVMRSVRDNPKTAVRACHGVGKTAVAAHIALWFLATRPHSRVITTAPTFAQVETLLWVAIRGAIARAHVRGTGKQFPKPNRTSLELAPDWFALGLSTNEPERFQGHHADHLLLIVDEASGVDDGIFEAAEGFLTAEDAKVLLIGNPTRIGGQFHRAFTKERARWSQIHISAYDSPNLTGEKVPADVARALVTREWVEDAEQAWGAASPVFGARVLAEFNSESDNDLIPWSTIEAAQNRTLEPGPKVYAADIARSGDRSVIYRNAGGRVRLVRQLPHQDLMQTTGALIAIKRSDPFGAPMVIDVGGMGLGVMDRLKEQGVSFFAFNGAAKPLGSNRPVSAVASSALYLNLRAETHWAMREAFLRGLIDLDPLDLELAAQLSGLRWLHNSRGAIQIESKEDMKKRGLASPDRSDAVSMTFALGNSWRPRRQVAPVDELRELARRVEAAEVSANSPEAAIRAAFGPQLTDEELLHAPM
jgi:phage terminase large subunit